MSGHVSTTISNLLFISFLAVVISYCSSCKANIRFYLVYIFVVARHKCPAGKTVSACLSRKERRGHSTTRRIFGGRVTQVAPNRHASAFSHIESRLRCMPSCSSGLHLSAASSGAGKIKGCTCCVCCHMTLGNLGEGWEV